MPIQFHPGRGSIVRCNFDGYEVPEMVKPRPVLVLCERVHRQHKPTCMIVALSTTPPTPIEGYHVQIELPGTPPPCLEKQCWVKGDMVYALSLSRFDLYRYRRMEGKRRYYYDRLADEEYRKARKAVMFAMGYNG